MNVIAAIIRIAILALVFQHEAEGKVYYIRTDADSGRCTYQGYIPGGKEINISPIKAPTAQLETNVLANIAGFGGKAGTGVMHLSKFTETIGKIAPKLGPALGVFGVAFGVVADFVKPSPADILAATNEAIGKLTEEVNDRFTDMKSYVDLELMNVVKERINVEYKHMFTMFSNCIKDVSLERVLECQEDANQYITSGSGKFMLFNMDDYSDSSPPTANEIKKMELTFLPFREYVSLNLMQLQVLTDTYKDLQNSVKDGPLIYRKHLSELSEEAAKLIVYARNMFKWIDKTYDEFSRQRCKETKTYWSRCTTEGSWSGNTACYATAQCQFDITIPDNKKCKTKCTVRVDGKKIYDRYDFKNKNYGYEEAGQLFAGGKLDKKASSYLNQQAADVKNYWQAEVLSSIPVWEEMKKRADDELSKLNDEINTNYNVERPQLERVPVFNSIEREYMPVNDFEFLQENDEKNTDLENRKLDYHNEENYKRSEYPLLKDAEYGEFNNRFENDLSFREKKYKDGSFSPRFKERYHRAFDTMKYFDDFNRAQRM